MVRAPQTNRAISVRIGPITILVFVITLCLAVMAVLAVATASANTTYTNRQASFTTDVYNNESAAQSFVGSVDATLYTGGVSAVRAQLNTLVTRASSSGDITVTASISDKNVLSATFETSSGRQLLVDLTLSDTGYTITKWKTSTDWKEDNTDTLWAG